MSGGETWPQKWGVHGWSSSVSSTARHEPSQTRERRTDGSRRNLLERVKSRCPTQIQASDLDDSQPPPLMMQEVAHLLPREGGPEHSSSYLAVLDGQRAKTEDR